MGAGVLEGEVRSAVQSGDFDRAATLALRAHGQEILELLYALHRSQSDGDDAFSLFAEALWRGLPKFEWQSSLRTWLYAVAKNSSLRLRRDARRRAARFPPLPDHVANEVAVVRTATRSYLRTAQRSKIAELRQNLAPEDQLLLLLRVDRGLPWDDLALVMSETPLDGVALRRESARLRKRFQIVKARLYELGRAAGLIGAEKE